MLLIGDWSNFHLHVSHSLIRIRKSFIFLDVRDVKSSWEGVEGEYQTPRQPCRRLLTSVNAARACHTRGTVRENGKSPLKWALAAYAALDFHTFLIVMQLGNNDPGFAASIP